MLVSEIMEKMIIYSYGNVHDINHFLKVHGYARTIAECEGLPEDVVRRTEIAAILHDIACPLCREKYDAADGKHQEIEGMPLTREFLSEFDMPESEKERIVYLVGHHHTLDEIDGDDYQVLIEADYLVNADESDYSMANIENMLNKVYKTETGKTLLREIYLR